MKRSILLVLACLIFLTSIPVGAEEAVQETSFFPEESVAVTAANGLSLNCKSAVLMEATTGTVLYEQNSSEALPPASVTKVMTLLLIMEAIDDGRITLEDSVTVSATAASMGGSQVYLKEGEQMKLEDLLKSVVIASANDAAVALAEYLYGSVSSFVTQMNAKAKSLGMKNTVFENVTGLDDTATYHLTSAMDIAIMSRELIKHQKILSYSSIWMDSIRDGAFGLTNTNRLVRFYNGCTGLKTGSTSKAGFCISVTAERNGISFICVIMGAESRDIRNAAAVSLLDWGFANYTLYKTEEALTAPIRVFGGVEATCLGKIPAFSYVLEKSKLSSVRMETEISESVKAPVSAGESLGKVRWLLDGQEIGSVEIVAEQEIVKIRFSEVLRRMLASFLLI